MLISKPKNLIKVGDIFSIGTHRLAIGDCRDPNLITRLVQKDDIKVVLTDPPYGVAYVESKENFKTTGHRSITNDHTQSDYEYRNFTKGWIDVIRSFLAKKNAFYVFNSDRMLFALRDGIRDAGCHFGQLLIWIKNQAVVGRLDYMPQHELIAYGWHGTHEFVKSKAKSVLFYPRPQKNDLHPTMKPVSLLRELILNSSRVGDVVYDGFGGSGSTLLACEQTKRKCLMVELDFGYCQVIIDRFEKLTGIKATKL